MRGSFVTVPLLLTPGLALLMVVRMSEDRLTPTPGMQGRDERAGTTTLDELRDLVAEGFGRALGDIATTNGNVRILGQKFDDLSGRVDRLEHRVFGSKLPPMMPRPAALVPTTSEIIASPMATTSAAPGEHRERAASLLEKTEANAGDLAELSGRLLAVETKAEKLESINKQQSKAMGLAMPEASLWKKAAALLLSRKGLEFALAIATLGALALGYERTGDALRKVQDSVQRLPTEAAPR
jgi:hypothetical protein